MGVDLKHHSEKCKRYKSSGSHLDNSMRLHFFGRLGCVEHEGYRTGIRRHNKEVTKKSTHPVQNNRLCEILWSLGVGFVWP